MDQFTFLINGDEVKPSSFSINQLTEILKSLNSIASAEAGDSNVSGGLIRIESISEGSLKCGLASKISKAIWLTPVFIACQSNDFSRLDPETLDSLQSIQRIAKSVGGESINFVDGTQAGGFASLSVETDINQLLATISGESEMLAHILRVGGKPTSPTANVRVLDQRTDFKTVSLAGEKLAQDLGKQLYKNVILRGEATWNLRGEIRKFKATSFEPASEANPLEAINSLRELFAGQFDDVEDSVAYVRKLRGEDNE